MDDDGYFTIVDRKKDMIITGGFKVYPAEIERVLCMHPAVALAAVDGVADEAKGELAKAYVILKPGAAYRAGAGRPLPGSWRRTSCHAAVQFTAQLPMTSSGKIMRRLLSEIDDGTR